MSDSAGIIRDNTGRRNHCDPRFRTAHQPVGLLKTAPRSQL